MVQRLERYGVKFEKDEHGEYAVRKVHRSGSLRAADAGGQATSRRCCTARCGAARCASGSRIENRVMPVRVLTVDGRAVGAAGFDTRTGEFVTVSARAR